MAIDLNGSNQYFQKSAALFSGTSDSYTFTLAAWCRPDERHIGTIIGADQGSGNAGRFALFSQTNRYALRRKGSYIQEPAISINNGNTAWFHVAGTLQKSFRELYVDGASRATQSTNVTIDPAKATNFYIGRDHSGKYWDGKIAECAAYSVILTATEIATLAAGFSPLFVRPDKLIGYWPLGGPLTPATSGADVTGTDGDATAYNSPTEFAHPYQVWPTAHQNIIYPLTPAPIIPGQGHDYAVPGNLLDYAHDSRSGYKTPRQAADYGVLNDGT
jgi:hypothetical protein